MSLRRAVEAIFKAGGDLSRVLPHYEWRPQQHEMAISVAEALERSQTRIVEAPTGVGKSLAYLVPGALWARAEEKVLLVSTHTRNLQDQIVRRDFPLLRRLSERRIEMCVLKGRSNYLCKRRWDLAVGDLSGTTEGEVILRTLEAWVQLTESGDFDEGPPLPHRLRGWISRICSDPRFCASGECGAETGCFFKLSRRKAREAQIVLVNHALLVIELFSENAGLPPHDALVVDEAHHLPRIAADALSRRVSRRAWRDALLGLGGQGEPGATDRVRKILRTWPSATERQRILKRVRELERDLGVLLETSDRFWEEFRRGGEYPGAGGRARYRLGAGSGGPFPDSTFPLVEAAAQLLEGHAALLHGIEEQVDEEARRGALMEVRAPIESARETLADLLRLIEAGEAGTVYWIEDDPNEGPALRSRPIELGSLLGERLQRGLPLVLTSATLAADGSTGFFARQCGLPEETPALVLPPVFDLVRQVRVLAPDSIHDPTEERHGVDLAQGILKIAFSHPRKTMILFTSHRTLQGVEAEIRAPLEDRGIQLFAQGRDASRQWLTESFVASDRAVLLGAASFWEGVDFPGEALEILILVRLPFPVPTDPFVEAYSERLKEDGIDPFESFMLPEAIVRFRQGFGRLIRRTGDRGVFVVLDPRIVRRGYGKRFQASIGVPLQPVATWDELSEAVGAWLETPV